MAKPHTFVAGELLTAQKVNEYLNPEVPKSNDPVITGWTNIPLLSGYTIGGSANLEWCRIGMVVYFRGRVSKSTAWNSTGYEAITPANAIPSDARSNSRFNMQSTVTGSNRSVVWAEVTTSGEMRVGFDNSFALPNEVIFSGMSYPLT